MLKTYNDPETKLTYVFDRDRLTDSYMKYAKNKNIKKTELYRILGDKINLSEEAVRKHIQKMNYPSLIEQIYGYGDFLEGDRYAFLSIKEPEESFYEKADDVLSQKDFVERCVQAVRASVVSIISEYAASDCFNSKYKIDEDILVYYRKKVDAVEVMIKMIHKNHNLVDELLKITTSLKNFVCACERPGVPDDWYETNPHLRFYSPSFDLMINDPESFKKAAKCGILDYYPSFEEKNDCIKYFDELEKDNLKHNYHYNESDYYQHELINTIDLLFKKRIEVLI